jgi:hypothetical protein
MSKNGEGQTVIVMLEELFPLLVLSLRVVIVPGLLAKG